MSKIICDVCGTSYPETATQCPICGCVRSGDAKTVTGSTDVNDNTTGTYTYVKGGRFSKSNVKKRNRAMQTSSDEPVLINEEKKGADKLDVGLIIVIIALLLAIVAVVIYIAMRFFAPATALKDNPAITPVSQTQTLSTDEPQQSTTPVVPCTQIILSATTVTLDQVDQAQLLNVTVDPVDTSDQVLFSSADESVAMVTDEGKIIAVGAGETTITVTCGNATAECFVVCNIVEEETTEASVEPTYSTENFKLNRTDFTMTRKGDTHILYNGEIPVENITWAVDNEKVVKVENGKVTAVGKGVTTVYAEYGGVKLSCIVRCADSVGTYSEAAESTDTETETGYRLNVTDVTLYLSKTDPFSLKLLDADNTVIEVEWTIDDPEVCSITDDMVNDLAVGRTNIHATYDGVTYTCIVRVVA